MASAMLVRSEGPLVSTFLLVKVGDGLESEVDGDEVFERDSLDESVDLADLAIERMLPVSESLDTEGSRSRGAEVGPSGRVVV